MILIIIFDVYVILNKKIILYQEARDLKTKKLLIFLAIISIIVIIYLNQSIATENFFKKTIILINEKNEPNEINAPKEFIKLIESIYSFSETSDFEKPKFFFTRKDTTEVEGRNYYSIIFESGKYASDGTLIEMKRLHIFVEMDRHFWDWVIVDFKILDNSFLTNKSLL